MFTTAAPAAPTLSATTHTVVVSSGPHSSALPRPSRLRDLSVSLRNYTHSLHQAAGSRANRAARDPDPRSHTAISSHGPHAASATSATSTPTVTPPTSPFTPTPIVVAGLTYFALERRTTAPEASDLPSHPSHPSHPGHHSHHPHRSPAATMTRTRAETAVPQLMMRQHNGPTPASTPAVPTMASFDGQAETPNAQKQPPSIRFIPHQDPRANRPSLQFPTITRSLPDESSVIRVGRYSERDNIAEAPANVPSAASVGFKSKVVSRKHCELWCKDSQWYIKDVKSSSGTFLNHIRLSQPNVESKPFKLKDGDIIQLGIDFRGGEEMIFRCVKIRVECNRGWQQALNTFNKQTHLRLRNLARSRKESDAASAHTSECSICLMSIAPCQSLFVAPCSHVWHYKCIRPILNGPTWPNFLCPNCRAVADLEADVEETEDFEKWDEDVGQTNGEMHANGIETEDRRVTPRESTEALPSTSENNHQLSMGELEAAVSNISIADSLNGIANQPVPALATPNRPPPLAPSSSLTQPIALAVAGHSEQSGLSPLFHNVQVSDGISPGAPDCPMTPRNDIGPFVLDGSAGRGSTRPSLDDLSPGANASVSTLPSLQMS